MSELLAFLMARAESMLVGLQQATEVATELALQFGYDVGAIGRQLMLHPELAAEVGAFVERTAPILRLDPGVWVWIHRVYDAADSRSSETLEYLRALGMRSDLEFFRDLY